MLRVGLIGLGSMGRGHFNNLVRLEAEGFPLKLVAICDCDWEKFKKDTAQMNIDLGKTESDFSKYNLYLNIDEMLEKEDLDLVDIVLPTYLHAEVTINALNKGLHVFCEKPMALNSEDCFKMIEASRINNRKLMIGQCLRFWPEYEILKEYVDSGKLGKVLAANFYRGGTTPLWSYRNWYLKKEKSGGVLLDQHVHDVDMINWLFGKPEQVSTIGKNAISGSGFDVISTHYLYSDNKVISAQDDWLLNGDYGFRMTYRVTFEKGNMVFENNELKINVDDAVGFVPECSSDMGYYRELKYFAGCVINDEEICICPPDSTMDTIKIAEAEMASAEQNGKIITVG